MSVAPPPPAAPPQSPSDATVRSLIAPLAAIVLGAFMAILDTTVVNVALPTLGRIFETNLQVLQWVITG